MKRNEYLIKSKFYKYLVPGILMTCALQLGNLVDSVFVGNFIGPDALSAINIAMPVVLASQILIMIFGVGGSITASICLGKRERDRASAVFTASFLLVFAFCVLNAAAAVFYCGPLCRVLSGTEQLADLSRKYMAVNLYGMPIMGIGLFLSYYMGIDNHPNESAALHIVANVINLGTDYLFIRVMGMGITGSALSTVVGYGSAGIFFGLRYMFSEKRVLQIKAQAIKENAALLSEALKNGLSSGLSFLLQAVKILILNSLVLHFIGDTGMAMYAVCTNSFMILQLCLHGVTGVIQTTGGILYGDRDYFGVRVILRSVLRISVVISLILTAVFLIAPGGVCGLFGFNRPALNGEMHLILQIFALSFLFYAFNNIAQSYYSCVGQPFLATFDTALQGFVILIPVTLAVIIPFGVIGTSIGSLAAETGAILLTQAIRLIRQKKGRIPGRTYDVLPEQDEVTCFDVTIRGEENISSETARALREFCLSQGISRRSSNILAIAGEEIVENIVRYGSGVRSYIDLCMFRTQETIILRVRDDGPAFNPVEYIAGHIDSTKPEDRKEEMTELPEITGLMLIRKMAQKIDYAYVLNMNNTIVEVPKEL